MQKVKKVQLRNYAAAFAVVGLAISPVAAGAVTDTTTVSATVNSTVSISNTGTVSVSLTPTAGGVVSSSSETVTVSTNATNGYTLTLENGDATRSLDGPSGSIAAHTGTAAAPTALAANSWGYAVAGAPFDASYAAETNNTTSATKWAGVPAAGSGATLKNVGAPASNDNTQVWFAVKADSTLQDGSYSDTVTYTATAN